MLSTTIVIGPCWLDLLAEDAGVPVPGETTLVFASFLAHKGTHLEIGWVIMIGIVAVIMGDNIGFFVGRNFGQDLLHWMKKLPPGRY